MNRSNKRPLTAAYIVFYTLFSPDTWRVLMGVLLALLFTPHIIPPVLSKTGVGMLYLMIAVIGWALSSKPAQWITAWLKKVILGNKNPGF
ncbi:MAG: hypothetical protein LJE94_05000 [Deltaproteobacteria bacterium]|nr:hypothetical protein [Deltaproteobacteria bacterium]